MRKWEEGEADVPLGNIHDLAENEDVGEDVGVGENDTLGDPCGPRGVDDRRLVLPVQCGDHVNIVIFGEPFADLLKSL